MFPDIQPLTARIHRLRARIRELARDERGYSTETVLVTALLVALAIAVIGIIALKVTDKAKSIGL
ncbi:hypothetical protein LO772_27300 [Yinghuangia sp. ASG 101]|uniref:hypothetical protein n=1 Tax=Yinghuangia sp. ASG 101 TaxID=2896848 RepID=UPI001E2D8101|nr:hypothetical protein [Yinghuangia sp. ASG 101]UGQ10521.1 hypothetical protein LO772_27300 [Yinghuangia sp. ASG 101]